jgi:hypothetical protein
VIYNYNNEAWYVIAPPKKQMEEFKENDPRRLLLKLRKEFDLLNADALMEGESKEEMYGTSMWWGKVGRSEQTDSFLDRLAGGTSTWTFADLLKTSADCLTNHRTIVLVSDETRATNSFQKHLTAASLTMSIWDESELLECRNSLSMDDVSDQDVKDRYAIVGGVPRYVFVEKNDWEANVEPKIRKTVARLRPDTLATTLVPGSDPAVTSRLVHEISKAPFRNSVNDMNVVTSKYASEYVRTAIYKRFLFEEQFKLRTWLQYTKGIVGGKERGPQFEWFAHVVLGKLHEDLPIKLTKLLKDGHGSTESKSLVPFAKRTVLYKNLGEILEFKVEDYAQPLDDNEPAIDAFCLSKGLPWREGADSGSDSSKLVLLLFQMTVARKHPTLGDPIKKIIKHVHESKGNNFDPKKHDIYLVFIVEGLLPKAEPYLAKKKPHNVLSSLGHLENIKQVCLQIE